MRSTSRASPCPTRRCRGGAGSRCRRPTSTFTSIADESEFAERVAHFAERAYRLNTRYLNWRPSGRVSVVLSDSPTQANGSRQLGALQLHLRLRRAPRLAGRAERLRRLREAAHHARVHARRAPGHDPQHRVRGSINTVLGQDLRAQPGAADLVHRGAGGADGVAPDDRRPPAQQLLRHAPAGRRFSRAGCWAWTRSRSIRPARLSAGQRPPTSTVRSLLRYIEDRYGPEKIREISHRYADDCIAGRHQPRPR